MRFLVAVSVLVVLAACGPAEPGSVVSSPEPAATSPGSSDAPISPSPTEEPAGETVAAAIDRTAVIQRGRYIERRETPAEGVIQWAEYDFERGYMGRWFGVLASGEDWPSQDEALLRFVVSDDRALMWNPGAETQCGTPWIEMTTEDLSDGTALPFDPSLQLSVAPLDAIRPHVEKARRLDDLRYEVPVPVLDVLPVTAALADDPALVEALQGETATANVDLADGMVATVRVDLSVALATALDVPAEDDGLLVMTWEMQPGAEIRPWEPPSDVAPMSCMDPPAEA